MKIGFKEPGISRNPFVFKPYWGSFPCGTVVFAQQLRRLDGHALKLDQFILTGAKAKIRGSLDGMNAVAAVYPFHKMLFARIVRVFLTS